jgi:hypothetical protein
VNPTFQGEVQFRRWSDSSTQGVQVTFALPDSDALEPLKGMEGKRFMAVLVQIGDDEQPVMGNPISPRKDTRGPLCKEACDLCKLPEFQQWALERADLNGTANENLARDVILGFCAVESRKDLDTVATAAEKFRALIRGPFMRWQREQRK